LGDKITSKPACVLDYDRLDPVAFNAIKEGRKAGAHFDRVSAAHGRVVEPLDDFQPSPFRKSLDGHPLALLAVLVCPDVRSR
jgi:hypothetical protein